MNRAGVTPCSPNSQDGLKSFLGDPSPTQYDKVSIGPTSPSPTVLLGQKCMTGRANCKTERWIGKLSTRLTPRHGIGKQIPGVACLLGIQHREAFQDLRVSLEGVRVSILCSLSSPAQCTAEGSDGFRH